RPGRDVRSCRAPAGAVAPGSGESGPLDPARRVPLPDDPEPDAAAGHRPAPPGRGDLLPAPLPRARSADRSPLRVLRPGAEVADGAGWPRRHPDPVRAAELWRVQRGDEPRPAAAGAAAASPPCFPGYARRLGTPAGIGGPRRRRPDRDDVDHAAAAAAC